MASMTKMNQSVCSTLYTTHLATIMTFQWGASG